MIEQCGSYWVLRDPDGRLRPGRYCHPIVAEQAERIGDDALLQAAQDEADARDPNHWRGNLIGGYEMAGAWIRYKTPCCVCGVLTLREKRCRLDGTWDSKEPFRRVCEKCCEGPIWFPIGKLGEHTTKVVPLI